MLFTSIEFLIFFPLLFFGYYFLSKKNVRVQNIFLLFASYVFYAWADWRFLFLLIASTLVFYYLGLAIFRTKNKKSLYTTIGVVFGVGMLGYFKYTNFFILSFKDLFESMGLQTNLHTFKIIMPLGISFYTFRLLSYLIDINREKYEPTRDIITFSNYVAFFPCILSGPIDRADVFIPQIQKQRIFNHPLAVDGLRQILWGAFKKMAIADYLSVYFNEVHGSFETHSGSTLLLSAVFYSFIMYADFSGYSDMAIGVAKLLGIKVARNFNYPFFAQNIADFWRRWHISLTSWLTDYVFMPLNVKWRDWGKWGTILAIVIDFILCGLWHGANWTFVLWGFFHGLLFIPLILSNKMLKKEKIQTYSWGFPKMKNFLKMLLTFFLVTIGLILFSANNIGDAFTYMANMFDFSLFTIPYKFPYSRIAFPILLVIIDWMGRKNEYPLSNLDEKCKWPFRWLIYYVLIFTILFLGEGEQQFIYFQF